MKPLNIHLLLLFFITGCTTVNVKLPQSSYHITHVCIRENPQVPVEEFLDVMRAGFTRHGITSEMVGPEDFIPGEYIVSYTASRNWDFDWYMTHAEIYIQKDERIIASATYHLKLNGGWTFSKYESVETKLDPVMDELLEGIPNRQY